ncbi:MAG: PD-(D/E)XK nuclease family protein [Caldilineae bacterium]|nr:MAG: PD-(D/E)XK nuclease family protein [Caldilineae bacterium]
MPLDLSPTFAFTQSSLQAYVDCPRRFWLAYVQQLPWPAVQVEPYTEHEQQMRLGARFHQLVERAEAGMDPATLTDGLPAPLADWFDAYLRHRPDSLPTQFVEVERVLSIPFASADAHYRLAARYDLIAAERQGAEVRVVIVDWKTTRRPTPRAVLQQRLQTRVYPFVLVEASERMPWGPLKPEQVTMLYWFAAAPAEPVTFRYSADLHAANHTYLHGLLDGILAGAREADFPKAPDTEANRRRLCNYCIYRSRCDRGIHAGALEEIDEAELFAIDLETDLEFTLEEVEELAF